MGRKQWEVVGGADKGGILVRQGEAVDSPRCEDRLSTGAVVEELHLRGGRLQYLLKKGTGPETGWVSIELPGKKLLVPKENAESGGDEILVIPGGEITKKAWRTYLDSWKGELQAAPEKPAHCSYTEFVDAYFARVMRGDIKLFNEGREQHLEVTEGGKVDKDFDALRARSIAKREAMAQEPPLQPLPPYQKFKLAEVKETAVKAMPGEMFGLLVPPTLADLYSYGAKWLTDAFHAAGTLPKDNAVARVVDFKRLPMGGIDAKGGSGPKAFITVEYERPDPELHNKLFVKMPWSVGGESHDMGGDELWRWKISCFMDNDGQEVTVYRMLGPLFPFKIPKYYFADICRANTNFILITEQLIFGGKGKEDFPPYEIQPLAEKYFDFQLPPPMRVDMYYCLVRAQARMAAWDKMGYFEGVPYETRGYHMAPGDPSEAFAGWPRKVPEKMRKRFISQGKMIKDLWEGWLDGHAKKALPAQFTEPKFLSAFLEAAFDTVGYKDDVQFYYMLFPEYTGMMHSNLQSDNAYYWRNADGDMDCGIIDWGGLSPRHVCNAFSGCITSCLGEVLDAHEDGLIMAWRDEYYKECGIDCDFGELWRQWQLAIMAYIYSCGLNIQQEIYRQVPHEEWKTITTLMDERTAGQWNTRCYVFMIFHLLKYLYLRWKRDGEGKLPCHKTFLEWRDYWIANGLE